MSDLTVEKVERVLSFVESQRDRIACAEELFTIHEGELKPSIEKALDEQLSFSASTRAKGRIAPINVLPKIVKKLSTLYNREVSREAQEQESVSEANVIINQEVVDFYTKSLGMNPKMNNSQKQFNVNKYTALEPFLDTTDPTKSKVKLRILPAHQFMVYSDNNIDPKELTVFVKILGQFERSKAKRVEEGDEFISSLVTVYMLYTKDQIIAVDSDREIRFDFMVGNEEGLNPFGEIPFIYVNDSEFSLLPNPDTDTKPMTILIPLLLTDLNYAVQFMSHSIVYAIDADIQGLSGNPDSVWNVKSEISETGEDNKRAAIGTIKPEVDISETLELIKSEVQMWLDTKGIKASSVGQLTTENLASGVSKMIDEGDTTEVRSEQETTYTDVERKFWELLGVMHNTWIDLGESLEETRKVTDKLLVETEFAPQEPFVDEEKVIRTEKAKLDARLTSHRKAVIKANPKLDETEIDLLIEEIEQDTNSGFNIVLPNDIVETDDSEEEDNNEE